MDKPILTPGPDHPITITPDPARVIVTSGGRTIADTTRALVLQEATYPVVHYVPREDADLTTLERSATRTYCPYKGDASHFGIRTDDGLVSDAVWSYETPHAAVPVIAGYLAFYPSKVRITTG